jgi:hypothetical protein
MRLRVGTCQSVPQQNANKDMIYDMINKGIYKQKTKRKQTHSAVVPVVQCNSKQHDLCKRRAVEQEEQ